MRDLTTHSQRHLCPQYACLGGGREGGKRERDRERDRGRRERGRIEREDREGG